MTPETTFPPIQQRLMEFIRQRFKPGYNHYNVRKLIGDATSRQYYRYVTDSGGTLILAAYPEPFDPNHFTYKQIYDLLQEIEIPVPEIVELNGELGIVLQEDLGDESLQKTLIKTVEKQKIRLLESAIDHIITIQEKGTVHVKPEYDAFSLAFDEEKLNWEFSFFHRQYIHNYKKLANVDDDLLFEEYNRVSSELANYSRVLTHRDFHVRNMMMKKGILYVIDFQDARWGPPSYDVVSLLKDSIELDPHTVDELLGYYLEKIRRRDFAQSEGFALDDKGFARQFNLMCIQRLLKALGTYAYQIIVRENFIYEQYMAGSLHRAQMALEAVPEFPAIRALVDSELAK
ncbi:MAG: phosphotransferase [Acidobacteriota bacterium]|nr:MAG: phosphotransferase [Acidobacteriota bacterium]